ncbi:hypothetical protein A3K87_06020 [Variovorax paradoxus]|uniref:Uncharacterized protein n=1 Tax=Variovorax paradoxus TaxID=34073 RepID=A0AA91DT50_VARPD|nr:hypothetical protein A3K87_06020 [Variovorax paradoxus]
MFDLLWLIGDAMLVFLWCGFLLDFSVSPAEMAVDWLPLRFPQRFRAHECNEEYVAGRGLSCRIWLHICGQK